MPKIFELFGYRVGDTSQEARVARKSAYCPFMNDVCDGGGNRYLSHIDLKKDSPLRNFFNKDLSRVPSGVCSIQPREDERPWIVCPRRLLTLYKQQTTETLRQEFTEEQLVSYSGVPLGTRLGVWSEVKVKLPISKVKREPRIAQFEEFEDEESASEEQDEKSFDYTFDYVLMQLRSKRCSDVSESLGFSTKQLLKVLEKTGYTMGRRDGELYIEDFPDGPPLVVEIMTSSTSGGNKAKRNTVPAAFEDAILGRVHNAPGINYRQVWARMASQLIVKSEVAIGWGGRTIWVLQDALVDYISTSTKLDVRQFLARRPSEVNILSLSYGDKFKKNAEHGVIELTDARLFAGPISSGSKSDRRPSFDDIIHVAAPPAVDKLVVVLAKKPRIRTIVVN
ncbi:MAG TPA: hypothetical protein VJP02_02885 [Candidatus Sulfotelmatobacter sp.]|nr:hypothetical protein [Candidatus Sulfotelmatobacter sp.]